MKTTHSAGLTMAAILVAASCGCSSAPTVSRGQNPAYDSAVTPAGHAGSPAYGSHGYQPAPLDALADHFRYTQTSRYQLDENGQVVPYPSHQRQMATYTGHHHFHGGANCPPNPGCPHCQGHPPHGHACPVCQSGASGTGLWDHEYPDHHFTYGYIRPKHLRYPPPEVPGGAVVYPYYTHKGPSDFFR